MSTALPQLTYQPGDDSCILGERVSDAHLKAALAQPGYVVRMDPTKPYRRVKWEKRRLNGQSLWGPKAQDKVWDPDNAPFKHYTWITIIRLAELFGENDMPCWIALEADEVLWIGRYRSVFNHENIAAIRVAIRDYAYHQGCPSTTAKSVLLDKYWQDPSQIPSVVDEVTNPGKALSNSFFTNRSDNGNSYASLPPMTLGIDPTTIGQSE